MSDVRHFDLRSPKVLALHSRPNGLRRCGGAGGVLGWDEAGEVLPAKEQNVGYPTFGSTIVTQSLQHLVSHLRICG
jgi:hypothetical protein